VAFSLTIENNIVHTKVTGTIHQEDISAHVRNLIESKLSSSFFIEILYFDETVQLDNIGPVHARDLAQEVQTLHQRYERSDVIVITSNPENYVASKMIEAFVTQANPSVQWHVVEDRHHADTLIKKILTEHQTAGQ
jgi:hypothetical protein